MSKVIVMDYTNAEVRVLSMQEDTTEEVEKVLTESYEYSLNDIEYMIVPEFKLRID
jgi:hypothetical protein